MDKIKGLNPSVEGWSYTMAVNRDKPDSWKQDVMRSVDLYNDWFMRFAPRAFRDTRVETAKQVVDALVWTTNLTKISSDILNEHPNVLPMLRMSTCPPIARDRLIGLARVTPNLVKTMELNNRLPSKMPSGQLNVELSKIGEIIEKMADPDIFTWLQPRREPKEAEIHRSATIIADRLCGAMADPIIRNAQERRQLAAIGAWLSARGYCEVPSTGLTFNKMLPGTYAFRLNVRVRLSGDEKQVNIPIDVVAMPHEVEEDGEFPLFIEAKSAGDFTNTNKRRKEEATKMIQLRSNFGDKVHYILFLCGYFDGGYLGYEAAEGIDWVWEHRIDDLALFGL